MLKTNSDIRTLRISNQLINNLEFKNPHEIVSWLGALQAQDYSGALWAVGLRSRDTILKKIERAIEDKSIVRTWPMRGTLHFVAAEDVHWMLNLLTPRIISKAAGRHKNLELNNKIFTKSYKLFEKALVGGKLLKRNDMMMLLENSGITTNQQRGYHILWKAAQEKLICLGPIKEKQQTFALLDEWITSPKKLTVEESLAELTIRYFESHGPATLKDFVWWSGLKVADAGSGVKSVKDKLIEDKFNGQSYFLTDSKKYAAKNNKEVYLLPGFDEYVLGYKDRSAIIDPADKKKIVPWSNGMFQSTVIINGEIAGTWKSEKKKKSITIKTKTFLKISKDQKTALKNAAEEYGNFLGAPIEIEIQK